MRWLHSTVSILGKACTATAECPAVVPQHVCHSVRHGIGSLLQGSWARMGSGRVLQGFTRIRWCFTRVVPTPAFEKKNIMTYHTIIYIRCCTIRILMFGPLVSVHDFNILAEALPDSQPIMALISSCWRSKLSSYKMLPLSLYIYMYVRLC